jgi:tRNA A-37 threonylcarbamoyl transferase component Bud32
MHPPASGDHRARGPRTEALAQGVTAESRLLDFRRYPRAGVGTRLRGVWGDVEQEELDNPGSTISEQTRSEQTRSDHPRTARSERRAKSGQRAVSESHSSPARHSRSISDSQMTARGALETSELGRMRILATSMMVLTAIGMGVALGFEGDPLSKQLASGAMAVLFGAYAYVFSRAGRPEMDQPGAILMVALPMCLAVVVANLGFGLLSPIGIPVAMGILLFASSSSRSTASTAFAVITGGFLACAVVTRLGLYTHLPLVPVALPRMWMWDVGIVLVLVLYAAAFIAGRLIRRDMAMNVERLERAVREASMRDALLREAREALKNAAGIGAPGRFTDQELEGFRLGAVIGRGGMGEVYAAERLEDGREAAVKLLRMDALVDRAALSRFEREARIVASIRSPNVVQVLGVSHAESVLPYIAMERLRGVDLASFLRERGRMSLVEALDMISQVAVGLAAAHAANVVHRDLKPNNLFRSGSDPSSWKILDFGVSKWMDSTEVSLTAAELVGTPQYMAPEQVRGQRDLDQTADIYALAAISYRALTGEAPFTGRMPAILQSITDDMPRAPSQRVELPHHIDYVLALGLAKNRAQRFQSAFEFAAAFALAAGNNLSNGLVKRAKEVLAAHPYEK